MSLTAASAPAQWKPADLYDLPAEQQPQWADRTRLRAASAWLSEADPLVDPAEVDRLRDRLARASGGAAFVLQAGDCAESFHDGPAEAIAKAEVLADLAARLAAAVRRPVVPVARIAGQYAKPRSAPVDTGAAVHLPAFRGHIVNGEGATLHDRQHDAGRLVDAYRHAARTASVLRLTGWLDRISVSHEALVLDYEIPQIHRAGEDWLLTSTHLPWIGARTNQPANAHIALASRIVNPVACKVTAGTTPRTLLDICARLDPHRTPGRLVLITRMGVGAVAGALPPLLRAVTAAGYPVTWICDPMHGNTVTTAGGIKTRHLDDVVAEIDGFLRAHEAAGTVAGGIHLELATTEVTECLGGPGPARERDLLRDYRSLCDPRLSPAQASALVDRVRWRV